MLNKEYNKLIAEIATDKQEKAYKLFCEGNSCRQIAKRLGKSKTTITDTLNALERKATKLGLCPAYTDEYGAGIGRHVGKVTTHLRDGDVVQEWIRTDNTIDDVMDQVKVAVKALAEDVKGRARKVKLDEQPNENLLSVYPLFDKHYGMMSWAKESGEDYDLSIAQECECETFEYLIRSQPASKEALVVFGGDYFHCDDDNQVTPAHKNKVDVDGRSFKVFGVGVKMAKEYIDMARAHHQHVTVELITGNHDPVLSMALLYVLDAYYCNDHRVTVNVDPSSFSYYEFGSTLIAFQHGDKMKQERMYQVVTTDKRDVWGRVKYCHVFTGHFHRERVIDIGQMKLESLRTTIPNEAYAVNAGYRAPKTAYAITFSRDGGEVGRTMKNI